MWWRKQTLVSLSCLATLGQSFPFFPNDISLLAERTTSIGGGVDLRILPLGDSVTYGFKSSDGNGYRHQLEQDLSAGNKVDMIGSVSSGSMPDNQNEGHNGAVISEIANYAQASLPMRPNVVLVHAGTNDMNQPNDPDNAPARLGSLIDEIVSACPDAAVLVAKIIPASNSATMSRIDQFNAAVPGVVAQRADAGKKVMVVDFSTGLTTGDLTDGLHPTDGGYTKMGDIWFSGIQQASDKGWIKAPVQGASFASGACSGKLVWMPQNEIASGPAFQSGGFKSTWIPKGEVASGIGKGSGVRFGDIDGDGRDDYLWVDDDGSVVHYLNTGTGEAPVWVPQGKIASGIGKDGAGVRFADMDGDGKADYLWVSEDGKVTCFLNRAGESPGKPTWVGIGEIASGTGAGRDRILFADLDGDGRDDYLVVGDNGQISAWYNTGNSEKPVWIPSGEVASGIGAAAGVRLGDINNDGRADYLWLSEEGALTVFLNGGVGRTSKWLPQGVIATGVGTSRENITFADLNGDGKVDYLAITAETGAVKMWLNAGSGSATETGDGVMFADLNGDKRDDYLWVDEKGAVTAYINGGGLPGGTQIWLPQGLIATGVGAKREDVRFADLNGDGRAEYLKINPDTGAVECWLNTGSPDGNDGPNAGKVTWVPQGTVATGIGKRAGVRFADLNGDGRDDYLWLDEKGSVAAYINGGGFPQIVWLPQGVIATGVGASSRDEIAFADINGDGRVDYLWVHPSDGSVDMWLNAGSPNGNDGPEAGKVTWIPQNTIATGVGTGGSNKQFADLNGDGRDEYLDVTPSSAAVKAWFNGCSEPPTGGSGGSGPITQPDPTTPPPTTQPDPTTQPVPTKLPDSIGGSGDHASCNDLKAYQTANHGTLESSFWDKTNTGAYFDNWLQTEPKAHSEMGPAFAQPWGIGQSFVCTMTTFCARPNCDDLQDPSAPDSGRAYNVLVSLANVNQYLYNLHQAIQMSQTRWNGLQVALQQTFWPGKVPDDVKAHDVLNGIMTGIGVAASLLGGPYIGVMKELINGLARSVDKRIKSSDESLAWMAKMELTTIGYYQGAINETVNINDGLMFKGAYNVLNPTMISVTQVEDYFYKMLLSFSINFAWRQQNVYLVSYPMTEDEFNNLAVAAGSNDFRLKHYYGGRGFYFQGIQMRPALLNGENPYAQNPPGWGEIEQNGFSTWDIIESSADAFSKGGFDFSIDNDLQSYLDTQDWVSTNAARLPGAFTIPHCQVMPNDNAKDIQAFADWLDTPAAELFQGRKKSSFCLCQDITDKNGKKFSDYIPNADAMYANCLGDDGGVGNVT